MYPNRPIAVNPVWQSLAVVHLFIVLAIIAGATKGLGVPDETGATLGNWFNMIHREVLKRKFDITSQAMEIVEFTKVVPFSGGVRAARLGFAGAANIISFPFVLLAFFGLLILPPRLLALFGLVMLLLILLVLFGLLILPLILLAFFGLLMSSPRLLTLFGLLIFPDGLFALFGLPVLPPGLLTFFGLLVLPLILPLGLLILLLILALTYFAVTLEPIFFVPVPIKSLSRFDLTTLTTRLHHFGVSLFFRYLNYTAVKGGT